MFFFAIDFHYVFWAILGNLFKIFSSQRKVIDFPCTENWTYFVRCILQCVYIIYQTVWHHYSYNVSTSLESWQREVQWPRPRLFWFLPYCRKSTIFVLLGITYSNGTNCCFKLRIKQITICLIPYQTFYIYNKNDDNHVLKI